jgi:hypothetical protein
MTDRETQDQKKKLINVLETTKSILEKLAKSKITEAAAKLEDLKKKVSDV